MRHPLVGWRYERSNRAPDVATSAPDAATIELVAVSRLGRTMVVPHDCTLEEPKCTCVRVRGCTWAENSK